MRECSARGYRRIGARSRACKRGSGTEKKVLDIFLYGNVLWAHGTSSNYFGCVQRGGGAAQAADSQLSGPAGAARRGDCGLAGDGPALGVEASAGVAGSGARQLAARRAPYPPTNQPRETPSTSPLTAIP